MHVGMMHVSMMRQILFRTNEPTDKAILGVGCYKYLQIKGLAFGLEPSYLEPPPPVCPPPAHPQGCRAPLILQQGINFPTPNPLLRNILYCVQSGCTKLKKHLSVKLNHKKT